MKFPCIAGVVFFCGMSALAAASLDDKLKAFEVLMGAAALPKSAEIVDIDASHPSGFDPIGNVKLTFGDGHTEKWTKLRRALMPHVSATGLVGWVAFESRGYRGYPLDNKVGVCWPDGHHRDFKANETYLYIEQWNFADDDTALVLKSRQAHGAADYEKYDLSSGKLVDRAHGLFGKDLPVWAQPFSD